MSKYILRHFNYLKSYSLLILFVNASCAQDTNKNNTKPNLITTSTTQDNKGKSSSIEVALGVIQFLIDSDTSSYFKLIIPMEGLQQICENNYNSNTDNLDYHNAMLDSISANYLKTRDNFIVRSEYIKTIMLNVKKRDISKASIDSIIVEPFSLNQYSEGSLEANWERVIAVLSFDNTLYYFEIPQIVEFQNRWFFYYPEFHFRTQKEMDFIKTVECPPISMD